MKVRTVAKIPPLPSSYSDVEALAHVRHHYPNPGEVLEAFFNRFEKLADDTPDLENDKQRLFDLREMDKEFKCPVCKSTLEVDLEI